jgi:hypothetical protein
MSDILHYIAEHPFFSLILLGIVVLAFCFSTIFKQFNREQTFSYY